MQLAHIDQQTTSVPLRVTEAEFDERSVLAVLPVQDLERGTVCVLAVTEGELLIASRTDAGGPTGPPGVAVDAVEWPAVGIGPRGLVGRVPGGLLGGAEATHNLLSVQAGERLYEARLPGEDGVEAVEDFGTAARHAGACDLEL